MRLALLILAILVPPFSARGGISSVVVTHDSVTISGVAESKTDLFERSPHEFGDDEGVPVPNGIRPGRFSLRLPRHVGPHDRLYSRWQLATDEHATWPTDVTAACSHPDMQPMPAKNRKGVGGIHPAPELFQDLVDLGLGHITVNILLGRSNTGRLDRLLKFAHENGIVVTAILLTPPKGSVLSHPDCDPSAKYALPNMTSAEGVAAFRNEVAKLATRYCKPGFPHGRISHWILGNEVDAGWVWTNAGEKTAHEYMDEFHRAMRVAHYTVRRFDPRAKVYISLTHHWNSPHRPNPRRFYKSKQLLDMLAARSKNSGDFEWGIAHHPYANDLFNPKTWEDQAPDDFDAPQITMKNIAVLDRYLRQPRFLYRGETVRTVLLSEQGYHTKGRDPSPEAEALQARAIAYAWEQMRDVESIEAFHYHRWIDHEREGGLNCGLWTVKPGTTTWPLRKKASWHLYRGAQHARRGDRSQEAPPLTWNSTSPANTKAPPTRSSPHSSPRGRSLG